MKKRPVPVTLIASVYIAAGAIGLAYHLAGRERLQSDAFWISLVRVLAIISGIYMLRGRAWARWLALAWMAYHVVLGAFHSWSQAAAHAALLLAFAFFLFRPPAARYFRR